MTVYILFGLGGANRWQNISFQSTEQSLLLHKTTVNDSADLQPIFH